MSYLLCLPVSDQVAIQDLIYYLEKQPATLDTLRVLKTTRSLHQFFDRHGETLRVYATSVEPQPKETGYIRIETPNNYEPDSNVSMDPSPESENILAEQMYVPPSAEQVIAEQAHRVTSVDIEYGVGEITKRVSFFLADPSIDMSSLRPTGPRISVNTGDIDKRELQERMARVADAVVKHPKDDDYATRGIGVKKAMEIADNPNLHNRPTLEIALRVLRDHILTRPFSSGTKA